MSRLIDADTLLNILERERKEHDEYGLSQRADGITDAIMDIIDAPTIEPQRIRGTWIRNDNGTYSCSVCQSWIPEEQHYYAQYCLHCGADMRGNKK